MDRSLHFAILRRLPIAKAARDILLPGSVRRDAFLRCTVEGVKDGRYECQEDRYIQVNVLSLFCDTSPKWQGHL